jgi:NAD(P)-dependent dehydrogenase (short-subunit alcohol dehydrogenase family)
MSTIVLITGGNRGLGRAYVEAILKGPKASTYQIIITARKADAARAAAKELSGTQVAGYGCDIEDEGQVEQLVKAVESEYGRVDILINNAGMSFLISYPFCTCRSDDRGGIRWASTKWRNDPQRGMDQIILP